MPVILPGSPYAPEPAPLSADIWRAAHRSWQAFHQQWWGNAARLQQGLGSLQIEQEDICMELQFLDQTSGRVHLLHRLVAAYASILSSHSAGVHGVVYIGQPSSGRSFLLFFVLLCRMAAGEPFHYTTSDGATYRFDESGVAVARASELNQFDVLWADCPPWSLVDSRFDGTAPPYIVTLPSLFTVHMAGVGRSEYKWSSRVSSHRLILNPWTCGEILECLPLSNDFRNLPQRMQDSYTTETDISAVVAQSGPYMRDVLREIMNDGAAAADIAMHLQPVTTVDVLFNMLGGLLLDERPIFDALFVRRRDPRAAHITEIDLFVVEFKSKLASASFIAHMRHLGIEGIKKAVHDMDPHPKTMLAVWTKRLFALEESDDDSEWQVSIGILDGFSTLDTPAESA